MEDKVRFCFVIFKNIMLVNFFSEMCCLKEKRIMGQKAWHLLNRMEGSFYLKPNEGRFQTIWNLVFLHAP